MKLKQSEHQIQTLLMNYLTAHNWHVTRLNSGKLPIGEGRSRRMVQLLPAGTPDLMAFKPDNHAESEGVKLVFIEVKVPGNKPTLLQKLKMEELEDHGARCIVAHSLEELQEQL